MSYSNRINAVTQQPEIWLQYHGYQQAKPAKDFKPGEHFMWNFGHSSTYLRLVKETAKTITIVELCKGTEYTRTFKKERLVAIGYAPDAFTRKSSAMQEINPDTFREDHAKQFAAKSAEGME